MIDSEANRREIALRELLEAAHAIYQWQVDTLCIGTDEGLYKYMHHYLHTQEKWRRLKSAIDQMEATLD